MLSISLMPICALILYVIIGMGGDARSRIQILLVVSFLIRMVLQYAVRNIAFFSNGVAGGDSLLYDILGQYISQLWAHKGFFFVTSDDLWAVGSAALPINMFALVIYFNGGQALEGCTALVALAACLTGYNFYKLSRELGASDKAAYWLTFGLMFSPGFLMYTSDGYKDGLVLFFQFSALASAVRLSRKLSILHAVIGVLSLWALWHVRNYLVFATLIPLVVGLVGLNSKSAARPVILLATAVVAIAVLGLSTNLLNTMSDKAGEAFALGTSNRVRDYSAQGGSGVTFDDDGSVYGALHVKLLYTLFSPFFWQGGSVGFHIGKIDSALTTYVVYRAIKTSREHWEEHRFSILTLLSFAIPMTFAYAMGMSNVGLILRQRIPIVVVFMVIAALGFKEKPKEVTEQKQTRKRFVPRYPPRSLPPSGTTTPPTAV